MNDVEFPSPLVVEKIDTSLTESAIRLFLETRLQQTPYKDWEPTIWPSLQKFNALHNPPLNESTLRDLYILITDEAYKATSENIEEQLRTLFSKEKIKGTYELARYIVSKYSIITVGEKEHEMFVYRDGMYMPAENEVIFPEVQRILGDQVTKSAKTETFHKIADMTAYPRSIFESAQPDFIPLANGVFQLSTRILHPHDPKYHFTYKLPITYHPKASCPKTLAFFDQILTPDQKETIQEWIGYYFYRNYMFKKAIIFVGEGDTGKTTLLEVIINLIGKQNISSVSLHKMTADKFAAAHLYEKHGNLVDELSAKDITDTGNFKVATGGGSISGEYKFGNQFSFNNFAKFTFACNKIPDVEDFDDEAYFGRWMVMRFEKRIEKKIPNFIAQLATDEERSGLFLWAIAGLERLLANREFSYKKTAIETKQEMMRSGSSIAIFAATQLTQETGAEITKEDLYERYTEFCLDEGLAAETIKMLGTKLPFYATYISEGLISNFTAGKQSGRARGWRNVKVADSIKTSEERADDEFNKIGN